VDGASNPLKLDPEGRAEEATAALSEKAGRIAPKPTWVRYNEWRRVRLPPADVFEPVLPVTVVIPSYQPEPLVLARTLAALERQTYPKELLEVVIVDDGSDPPVELPAPVSVRTTIVRQDRRGFGIARARNTGARAASHGHGILIFLDGDIMAEAEVVAAHARWHHVVADAVTAGFIACVPADGITPRAIRCRDGSIAELISGRPTISLVSEPYMIATRGYSTGAFFLGVHGGNFALRKATYLEAGGSDESFNRWGAEEAELAYRVWSLGGLIVPVIDEKGWHQGLYTEEDRSAKEASHRMQLGKTAQLVPFEGFRSERRGRIFQVPRFVVTVESGNFPVEQVIATVTKILADRVHDLVVRVELPADERGGDEDEDRGDECGGDHLTRLLDEFGPDPRVNVRPERSALDEYPASLFHVFVRADVVFAKGLVHRLRRKLRGAVVASAALPNGATVSITRGWAAQRARRAGGVPGDYGDVRTLSARALRCRLASPKRLARYAALPGPVDYPTRLRRFLARARDTRHLVEAWSLVGPTVVAYWMAVRRRPR